MPHGPRFTPLVASLPASVPFVGPEAQERARGRPFRARIGANENAFGPSPAAIRAMAHAAREVWKYGDPENHDLREALASRHGIAPENVVVGEGIDGLLGYLVRLVVAEGDVVVTSRGAYPTFNYHVTGFGGRLEMVPYRDDREDLEALAEAAERHRPKLVYLANPDNPMGTWHGAEAVARLLEALPEGTLLVLDEAYAEFAPPALFGALTPACDIEDPRLVRLRTFSKAYGMAGARIGYALGARPLIAAFDKVRNHFGVNRIAQAGALAALADAAWLEEVVRRVDEGRARLAAIARENGLAALPSATNFVAIDCGGDGSFARAVLEALAARDIFVRMPFAAPQDRCIRVSVGRPEDMAAFAAALPEALATARAARDGRV